MVSIAVILFSCGGGSGAPVSNIGPQGETTTAPAAPDAEPTTTTAAPDTTEGAEGIPGIGSPCDIADVTMVEKAFEAFDLSVEKGLKGYAENCTYWLGSGFGKIDVFYEGAAGEWERLKADWEAQEGGIVEVDGIGEGAYHPTKYHGVRDLVFMAGDHIFLIVTHGGADEASLAKVEVAVKALASSIVDKHS